MTEQLTFDLTKCQQLNIADVSGCTCWDEWLYLIESNLKDMGYRRYNQNVKREDFAYWKTFYIDDKKAYQIGLFFYDFRKYKERDPMADIISIQYECMHIDIDSRIDLTVSKNIPLWEFETMAHAFYEAMKPYSH